MSEIQGQQLKAANAPAEKKEMWYRGDYIGWALGVIGIALAFYFYYRSEKSADIAVWTDPTPSKIIDVKETSRQPVKVVRLNGTEISQNLYTERVIVWNKGNKGVRDADFLAPITIGIEGTNTEVLRAGVDRSSVGLETSAEVSTNAIRLHFKALEPGDGVLIQFTYLSASPFCNVGLSGKVFEAPLHFEKAKTSFQKSPITSLFMMIGTGTFGIFVFRSFFRDVKNVESPHLSAFLNVVVMVLAFAMLFFLGVGVHQELSKEAPPGQPDISKWVSVGGGAPKEIAR